MLRQNPYAPSQLGNHTPQNVHSFWRYAALLAFVPLGSAILAGFVAGKLKQIAPDVDSRHISLVMSWVWTVFAIPVAIASWTRGHSKLAVAGLLFWAALSAYATLITLAF